MWKQLESSRSWEVLLLPGCARQAGAAYAPSAMSTRARGCVRYLLRAGRPNVHMWYHTGAEYSSLAELIHGIKGGRFAVLPFLTLSATFAKSDTTCIVLHGRWRPTLFTRRFLRSCNAEVAMVNSTAGLLRRCGGLWNAEASFKAGFP